VRLPFEVTDGYDTAVYAYERVRAKPSVASPFGLRREGIRRYLREHEDASLLAY
jgi:hypothetical protein